jgi:hypothetical protein
MFVNPNDRVAVTLDGNTIYIKAKMDIGTRSAVQDEIRATTDGTEATGLAGLGSYRMALLRHNIVAWEGPAFEGYPCTRANISRLDPDEPLVELVAEEIGKRNAPRESPDPSFPIPTGS